MMNFTACIQSLTAAVLKTRTILKAYNGERVFPKGEVYHDFKIGGKIATAKFVVIDDAPSSLVSGKTREGLELLSIKRELFVNSVSDVKGLTEDAILQEHNDVFTTLLLRLGRRSND